MPRRNHSYKWLPGDTRRVTKAQKGGYYFSVYHGVQNAGILLPLVFRQAHRLLTLKKSRTGRRVTTKRSKDRRRGHSLKDR
jgi:hypothetical protein